MKTIKAIIHPTFKVMGYFNENDEFVKIVEKEEYEKLKQFTKEKIVEREEKK